MVPPLRDYSLSVLVDLATPLSIVGSSKPPAARYLRRLGVRSTPDRLRSFVENAVPDGAIRWDESTCEEACPDAWDASLRERFTPIDGEGIWYKSGRVFFPRDESETH